LRRKPFGLEVKENLSRLRSTRKVRSFARNSVPASNLVNDLLVDEKVGGVLEHLHAQPVHRNCLSNTSLKYRRWKSSTI